MPLLYTIIMTISSFMIYESLDMMGGFSALMRNVNIIVDKANEVLDIPPMDIELKHVSFAYEDKKIIDDVSLKIPAGTTTAIVGPTGGEKQRISIARAIMKDAPIIILDEATANVDPENEAELTKAIEELTRNKTIIMIAHRLKTVRHADQILVKEAVSWKIA